MERSSAWRPGIGPAWADEAVDDDHAVWLTPDPASRSGKSVSVIGTSIGAQEVLTVTSVSADVDVAECAIGDWWGSNAWVAIPRDRRLYGEED